MPKKLFTYSDSFGVDKDTDEEVVAVAADEDFL